MAKILMGLSPQTPHVDGNRATRRARARARISNPITTKKWTLSRVRQAIYTVKGLLLDKNSPDRKKQSALLHILQRRDKRA